MDERTRLLPTVPQQTSSTRTTISYNHELLKLTLKTIPISLSFALQNIVQACSILVVGQLGTFELGVASYGYMFATCTGSMVAIGGSTALDTLCGQAFNSETLHKNSRILGVYLQRGLLLLGLFFFLVIAPVWWLSGRLFVALGQGEEFAKATGIFLRTLIPGGFLQVVSECLKKTLQVQHQSYAVGWIVVATSTLGVLANVILINFLGVGLVGAPIAHFIYGLSNVLFLLIYITWRPELRSRLCVGSKEVYKDLAKFSILAFTGILTVATEWWR